MYKLVNWIIWRLGLSFFSFSELVISSAFEFRFVLAGINTFGREEKCFTRLMFCKYYPSNRARSSAERNEKRENFDQSIDVVISGSVTIRVFCFHKKSFALFLSFLKFYATLFQKLNTFPFCYSSWPFISFDALSDWH